MKRLISWFFTIEVVAALLTGLCSHRNGPRPAAALLKDGWRRALPANNLQRLHDE